MMRKLGIYSILEDRVLRNDGTYIKPSSNWFDQLSSRSDQEIIKSIEVIFLDSCHSKYCDSEKI